jgi:16S rRNA U516 pseudouridylate synthase RsuA-like enzyme
LNELEASGARWVMGPSLPKAIFASTMNEFQNGVILIGGENQVELYQLTSPNGTWTKMKQTLKEGRYGHVSFLVPDELVNCH